MRDQMCTDVKHIKKLKIRVHELRGAADTTELNRFLQDRKGVINVEVSTDLFTTTITYDDRKTSPEQILSDLSNIRFNPEGSTALDDE